MCGLTPRLTTNSKGLSTHVYTHVDSSGEEGVTPLLLLQLTLSHVARVGPRLVSLRQLTLTCTAGSIALSAALATADAYGRESIAPLATLA